jgi:carbonic anhydrase
MISAQEALERLRDGNRRFVSDVRGDTPSHQTRRRELAAGQEPFAIILGCSDSRVPAEMVFDQGLGDLFVIRVAGNIVAPSQVGSVEFAAERFGTRLVVVLGHSKCGAILATLEELGRASGEQSRNLRSIVDRIRPSVEALLVTELGHDPDELVHHAIRANIRASADHLRHGSEVLEQLIQTDGLLIVGAEYSLETGVVDFFDGVPRTRRREGELMPQKKTQKKTQQKAQEARPKAQKPQQKPRKALSDFGRRVRVSDGFRAFALDQLSQTREVSSRNMFGGAGLYAGDLFFGILAGDVLYLKTDDETRHRFVRAHARPFKPYPNGPDSAHYYEVPLPVLEDVDELRRWVADAVAAAERSGASKRAGASKRKSKR